MTETRTGSVTTPARGPEDPFGLDLESYRGYLLAVARQEFDRALWAKGDPSDLVQETFAAALRDRHQFHGLTRVQLRRWLRGILRHHLEHFRRRYCTAACRTVRREVPLDRVAAPPDPDRLCPVRELLRAEQVRVVAAAVAGLPDESRLTVVWRLEEGLTFAAIGGRLGRSEEAVRKLFTRALAQLRTSIRTSAG